MSPAKKRKKKTARKRVKKLVSKKAKKSPKKKAALKKKVKAKVPRDLIGEITHYFGHVNAAVVKLKRGLAVGDTIRVKGHTTDFSQTVTSIQLDHQPLSEGKKGQEIGMEVTERVRTGDQVFRAKEVSS